MKTRSEIEIFEEEKRQQIASYASDVQWQKNSLDWLKRSFEQRYMYHFSHMGRPIIQLPQDIVAMQEIIWSVKPDLIIETGIAHGGSLILSASMLALLEYCDAIESDSVLDPKKPKRQVLGVDIDIRAHNKKEIEAHPMSSRIKMIQGSSIDPEVVTQVRAIAAKYRTILVCLDSNHTHDHVLAELEAYASLVTVGSYCVVFDTIVEDMPEGIFADRPWKRGDSPKTAIREWLNKNPSFKVDVGLQNKLILSLAPDGYLKRVKS